MVLDSGAFHLVEDHVALVLKAPLLERELLAATSSACTDSVKAPSSRILSRHSGFSAGLVFGPGLEPLPFVR